MAQIDLSNGIKPAMPHKEYLTYGLFPLVLAGILALTEFLNIMPFDNFDAGFLKMIIEPMWLVKYFAFTFLVGLSGNLVGLLMISVFKPIMNFLGIQVVSQIPELEPERPTPRSERRAKRNK